MAVVASGPLNKQVGGELNISEITVKAHRGQVMRKMKADSPRLSEYGRKTPPRTFAKTLTLPRPMPRFGVRYSFASAKRNAELKLSNKQ